MDLDSPTAKPRQPRRAVAVLPLRADICAVARNKSRNKKSSIGNSASKQSIDRFDAERPVITNRQKSTFSTLYSLPIASRGVPFGTLDEAGKGWQTGQEGASTLG